MKRACGLTRWRIEGRQEVPVCHLGVPAADSRLGCEKGHGIWPLRPRRSSEMKPILKCTALIALMVAAGPGTARADIILNTFVSITGGEPIGFAYAGDKFVGSNYFSGQLYHTDLNGGSVMPFGPLVVNPTGEDYVSSSLGLGGFRSRDIYV